MARVLNKAPLILTVDKKSLEDRIDPLYYHPNYMNTAEVLSNLPMESKTLNEISYSIQNFGAYALYNKIRYVEKGIPFLRQGNIKEDEIDLTNVKYITPEHHQLLRKSQVKPNSVLLTMTGNPGIATFFPETFGECNSNQHIAKIVLKKNVNPRYVSAFLNSKLGRTQIERMATGTTHRHIFLYSIKSIKVPIPSKSIQVKIARITSEARARKRRNFEQIKELREELEKFVFGELGLEVNCAEENREMVFVSKLNERFDPYYYYPDFQRIEDALEKTRFELKKLKDLVEFSNVKIDPKKEPNRLYKYIQIQNIDEEKLRVSSYTSVLGKKAPGRATMLIREGDILLPVLGGSLRSVAIVPKEFDGEVATNGFSVLRTSNKNLRYFIFYYLTSEVAQKQLERLLTGTIMPSISKSELRNFLIPSPDSVTLRRIAEKIQEVEAKIKRLQEASAEVIAKAKRQIEEIIEGKIETSEKA